MLEARILSEEIPRLQNNCIPQLNTKHFRKRFHLEKDLQSQLDFCSFTKGTLAALDMHKEWQGHKTYARSSKKSS